MIDKEEFPPLLPPGFHVMTLAEIRAKCVTPFPLSQRRQRIMDGLEKFVLLLQQAKIVGDLWIDGSFTTEKMDPDDVDVLLYAHNEVREKATLDQMLLIERIEELAFKNDTYYCDTYITYYYDKDDALHAYGEWMRSYWITQYGFSRRDEFKGLAVLELR